MDSLRNHRSQRDDAPGGNRPGGVHVLLGAKQAGQRRSHPQRRNAEPVLLPPRGAELPLTPTTPTDSNSNDSKAPMPYTECWAWSPAPLEPRCLDPDCRSHPARMLNLLGPRLDGGDLVTGDRLALAVASGKPAVHRCAATAARRGHRLADSEAHQSGWLVPRHLCAWSPRHAQQLQEQVMGRTNKHGRSRRVPRELGTCRAHRPQQHRDRQHDDHEPTRVSSSRASQRISRQPGWRAADLRKRSRIRSNPSMRTPGLRHY